MRNFLLFSLFVSTSLVAQTECVAHRGNSSEFLENSWEAFRSSISIGVDRIEFDVRHTKDGEAIIMHDSTLRRTAESRPNRRCRLNTNIKDLTGKHIARSCRLQNGDSVPTLRSLLMYLGSKEVKVFIEMKDRPNAETLKLIKEEYKNSPDKLAVISFSASTLRRVAKSSLRSVLEKGASLLHVSSKERDANWDFDGIAIKKPSASFMRSVWKEDLLLGVWTIDRTRDIRYYLDQEVDYLTTNYPRRCLKLRGQS